RLHRHVNVFFGRELQPALDRLLEELDQARVQAARVVAGDEAAFHQHAQMREAAHEILADQGSIQGERGGEGEDLVEQGLAAGGGLRAGDAHHASTGGRAKSRSGRLASSMMPTSARWSKVSPWSYVERARS